MTCAACGQRVRASRLRWMAVLELRRTRRRGIRRSSGPKRGSRLMDADDLQRLKLLVNALGRHQRESIQYCLAECLEDEHRGHAEVEGLPEPVDSYGDTFVARELSHAHAVLGALCGVTTCQAPGCSEEAPRHWSWCWHHDLEEAQKAGCRMNRAPVSRSEVKWRPGAGTTVDEN